MTAGAIVQMVSITCPSRMNRPVCLLMLVFHVMEHADDYNYRKMNIKIH